MLLHQKCRLFVLFGKKTCIIRPIITKMEEECWPSEQIESSEADKVVSYSLKEVINLKCVY